jgi:hypothetical protein
MGSGGSPAGGTTAAGGAAGTIATGGAAFTGTDAGATGNTASPSDASADSGGTSGGADATGGNADAGRGPWSTPNPVAELVSTANDRDVTLTADRLEMYFRSDRSGPVELWVTTRTSTSSPWGTPVLATALNTNRTELTPEIAGDGLTIWWSTDIVGSGSVGSFDIYVSTRTSRTAAWSAPAIVTEVSSTAVDFAATPFQDQLTLFVTSQRAGGFGGDDIFISTRATTGSVWGAPVQVPELCTATGDSGAFPVDPNDIYLASFVTGDQEIFVSRRASTADPFGAPVQVVELGSTADDEAPWVSADERDIFFSSDRSGTFHIYESTR